MAKNKLYRCPYQVDHNIHCSMDKPCLGCGDFLPNALVFQKPSYNSAMLEIALLVKRVFDIASEGSRGKHIFLEKDINAVLAQLQQ